MPLQLVVIQGPGRSRTIRLRRADTLIGSGEDCRVCIPKETVSRHHCLLRLEEGRLLIKDLDSTGGTYVNGRQVTGEQALRPGDQFTVGPVTFAVVDQPAAAPPPAAAPAAKEPPPVAGERDPLIVLPNEKEAEAEVQIADIDPAGLPVATALEDAAPPAGADGPLPDAAPDPTAGETARAVGTQAGRFAGTFATDVARGTGKGLVRTVLGGFLTDLLFERPWKPRTEGDAEPDQDEAVADGAPELRPVVRLACRHCQAPSWTTADRRGSVLLCPHCRRPLEVPRKSRPDTAGGRRVVAPVPRPAWGLRLLALFLGAVLAVAAFLFVSGWWGPLLWQPLQWLLQARHVPRQLTLGIGLLLFGVVGYCIMKLRMIQNVPIYIDFETCRADDFSLLDRRELVRCTKAFEALGFVRALDYTPVRPGRRRRSGFARLMVHPGHGCFAEINQLFTAQGRPGPMRCMALTLFEDGWSLSATNRPQLGAGWMMRRPRSLWTSNPEATPAQLVAGHLKRRERMAADLGIDRRRDLTPEAFFAHVRSGLTGMRRALWRKNLLLGIIEARLYDASPRHEWLGEYGWLRAGKARQ